MTEPLTPASDVETLFSDVLTPATEELTPATEVETLFSDVLTPETDALTLSDARSETLVRATC